MDKIIDIKVLSKMPITKEFAELLFGEECDIKMVSIDVHNSFSTPNNYLSFRYGFEAYYFHEDGEIDYQLTGQTESLVNAFQIVRYIDDYLNSLKEK